MKIALIGCGRIGFKLENDPLRYKPCTHWGGATAAGLKISLACDINSQRLKEFSSMTGVHEKNCYTDYRQLLKENKPEMAIIATWTDSHAPIAIDAAHSGARVIILEKPVAASLNDAAKIITACEEKKTSLLVNHERRYDSRYIKLKKILNDGIIGEVKTVHACMLTGGYRGESSPSEGGGPLMHDGTHIIDMLRYLFGEIDSVRGSFQRGQRFGGYEDRAVAWLKVAGGIDVFLEAGGNREYFIFELQISGTSGKIIVGNGYQKLFLKEKSRLYTGFHDLAEKPFPQYKNNNCFTALYQQTKKLLNNKETVITSTGIDGYRAVETVHSIYYSAHLKGKEVPLPVNRNQIDLKKIFSLG